MGTLPGWNTIAGASSWSKGFAVAGFVALFFVVVFDVLAFIYSEHRDTLVAAEELKRAAEERKRQTPRGLYPDQQDRMVAKLSFLKGYQAEFGVSNQTLEQVQFMRQLEDVFKRAQWSVSENQPEASGPFGAITKGVLARATSDGRSVAAAFIIRNALLDENIAAHTSTGIPGFEPGPPKDNPYVYRVLIIIGEKP